MPNDLKLILVFIWVIFILSMILSAFNIVTSGFKPCNTYGYYLPVTYCLCNLNEARK